ncbi:methyltransferase domain-containing protein [Algoriphagus sp. C2-6-M1]|uniref:class I SAM-dependent methyltransferase n=1 Tax=Algoriphagus persicinus TaxID=3108754 RepID=UPI002B381BBF|nr:methyltransferase domain-containing protein [Algoriphagus sp. C2-6-M1]MEB2782533.1 methyltransferase domain-containing protein [Algoriphagus sp. C2-6-M1]
MDKFEILENEIENANNTPSSEKDYFEFHKHRFKRCDQFLYHLPPPPHPQTNFKVLEIGCHYLHTSILLSSRGFQVDAMDVTEFWELDFVRKRGEKHKLHPIIENDLSKLNRFAEIFDEYDLIVFTEILEHITFNPIHFWKRIYQILKPGGIIYISTPNAFALPSLVRNFKNTMFLKSIGISVDDIFSKVTYGHHWKEYSANEIQKYFNTLSPDFDVEVNPYKYKVYNLKPPYLMFKLLSKIGNMTTIFADDLEVIVRLKEKTTWGIEEPHY